MSEIRKAWRGAVLIRVLFGNGRFDMVKPLVLDRLITSKRIRKFLRSNGWVSVERDPIRKAERAHDGPERRGRRTTEGHDFLQCILESIGEPITVIGPDYTYLWMNQAAREFLTGMSPQKKFLFCFQCHGREVPCDDVEFPCPINRVRESHGTVTIVHEHQNGNGEKRLLEIMASPLRTDGDFQGIVETARDITGRSRGGEERDAMIEELRTALSEGKDPKGLVPMCAWCKKIRDDDGYWKKVEEYIESHSGMRFTHGICVECLERVRVKERQT